MLTQSQIRAAWYPRCTGPWATIDLHGSGRVTVRAAIYNAVKALDKILIAYNYQTRAADTGAYNCRLNTSGTAYSMHAYGIAIDINWLTNPYLGYLKTDMTKVGDGKMPHRICAIRTNNGRQVWNWGGFWSGNKDSMHYEIVCSPSDLKTGINWSTVWTGSGSTPTPTPTPTPEVGDIMYRIYWYKAGRGPIAAYRVLCGRVENKSGYWPVSAWWIRDMTEFNVWTKERGLRVMNSATTPTAPRPSTEFFNGPYDNTKTV